MNPRAAALICGFLALLLGSFTLGGDFVMEEKNVVIEDNQAIRDLSNIPGFFAGSWIDEGLGRNYYRPVVTTIYTLQYALFGLNPFGWHAVNVLLYALSVFAATLLIARMSNSSRVALAGGIVFAIHPVHVEPVAVVSYQTVLLAGLFVTLGMLNFAALLDRAPDWRRLIALGCCAALGAMSKEEAFVLPILMAAWSLIYRPENWKRTTLVAAGVVIPILVVVFVARAYFVAPIEVTYFAGQPTSTVVLTMLGVVVRYIQLLLVPLRLCAFYEWFIVPPETSLSYTVALGIVLVLAAAFGVLFAARKKRNDVALAIAWIFLALLPVLQIFPFVVVAAERYLFIPSIGWSLLAGSLMVQLVKFRPRGKLAPAIALCALLAAGMTVRFVMRTFDWRNDFTLNAATIRDFPQTPTPHLNLARLYEERGELAEAEKELLQAIKLVPAWELPRRRLQHLRERMKSGG